MTRKELSDSETRAIALEIFECCRKNGTDKFRIESFGDLQNTIHAVNYLKIVFNLSCLCECEDYLINVGLWTKNFDFLLNAWDKFSETEHVIIRKILRVMISSVFCNMPVDEKTVRMIEEKLGMAITVFTVYTTNDESFINCGKRSCNTCGRCYKAKTETDYINEYIK